MKAVLYVSHGSRVEKTRKEAISFIHSVQKNIDVPLCGYCFLELATPTVDEAVTHLVEKGATEIAVVPMLLLGAGHYYEDIPDELEEVKKKHPYIHFQYGEPIGVQDRITEILHQRVKEIVDGKSENINVLLVGRGSRHPTTQKAIKNIGEALELRLCGPVVDVCFLAACAPTFEEGLQLSDQRDSEATIVVPYLWFTGILFQSMKKKVNLLKNDREIYLTEYLGHHPAIIRALTDRVQEALQKFELHSPEKTGIHP
ncbi:sirohydrochlorin chelatase [Halobacillus yeomjeoni]|uniref:Sirohydrochlorin chelatase n=1 Tax=Halobacillus yeomjeoni TaxID=311194 RepID=A0A931HTN3_9BACI|nr:sirohydrochlorin chelatase [Halobacillus yeomjeoni]MBH0229462.1 sirohydrochlorin chelatase [Halobacillus yeomjeoni]